MTKNILIRFERGGEVVVELLAEKAPKTCKAILAALPVEDRMVHAMWAGEETFFGDFPLPNPLRFENETNDIDPGDVACISSYAIPGLAHEKVTSFCIFYGKSRPRKGVDQTIDVNVFGKIKDIKAMAKIGRRIRLEGVEKVWIKSG